MQSLTVADMIDSKSISRLESILSPMAEQIDRIHHRTGSFGTQLEELHHIVKDIAGCTPQILATQGLDSRPPSSLYLDSSRQTSSTLESFIARDFLPPRHTSRPQPPTSRLSRSSAPPRSPDMSVTAVPSSPTSTTVVSNSPTTSIKKHISDFSFGGLPSRHSGSYVPSEAGTNNNGWPSPATNRFSHVSRQPSTRESTFARSPEVRERGIRPDSTILPALPPPAMDMPPDPEDDQIMAISKVSLNPPTQPEIVRLHRSSTTTSQKEVFEKHAFRNSAILCDV